MEDLTVLDYWKNNGHEFGDLRMMARDVFSIPIFTAVSDSAFSIGGSIFKKYRSCMLSKNLQARICSHNWLYGFSPSGKFCLNCFQYFHNSFLIVIIPWLLLLLLLLLLTLVMVDYML